MIIKKFNELNEAKNRTKKIFVFRVRDVFGNKKNLTVSITEFGTINYSLTSSSGMGFAISNQISKPSLLPKSTKDYIKSDNSDILKLRYDISKVIGANYIENVETINDDLTFPKIDTEIFEEILKINNAKQIHQIVRNYLKDL